MELCSDDIARVPLNAEAFDAAIEAATEAHVAGLEPHDQLEHGIKAYLLALTSREPDAHQFKDPRGRWNLIRNPVELKAYRDINATMRSLYVIENGAGA